jgi:hypothetical protein
VVTGELRKGVDKGLVAVTPFLDLLEVFPRELLGLRVLGVARGAIPKRFYFGF